MSVPDARRLTQLEEENGRLKKLLAEAMLDNAVLKDITARDARCSQSRGGDRCARGAPDQRATGPLDHRFAPASPVACGQA
jgi:putative transposase